MPNLNKDHILFMVDKIEIEYVIKEDLSIIQNLNLFGSCDPLEGFPIIKLHNSKAVDNLEFHPFYIIIKKIMEDSTFKERTCDFIFSKFLYSASKLVNKECYLILVIFFRNLRDCINQYGYSIIKNFLKEKHAEDTKIVVVGSTKNQISKKIFCANCSVKYIPLLADKFILEYVPINCSQFNTQLATDIILDFCNWLVKWKLTKIKITKIIKIAKTESLIKN